MKFVEPVLYDQLVDLNEDMKVVFNDAEDVPGLLRCWYRAITDTSNFCRHFLRHGRTVSSKVYVCREQAKYMLNGATASYFMPD